LSPLYPAEPDAQIPLLYAFNLSIRFKDVLGALAKGIHDDPADAEAGLTPQYRPIPLQATQATPAAAAGSKNKAAEGSILAEGIAAIVSTQKLMADAFANLSKSEQPAGTVHVAPPSLAAIALAVAITEAEHCARAQTQACQAVAGHLELYAREKANFGDDSEECKRRKTKYDASVVAEDAADVKAGAALKVVEDLRGQ
jgi:hypothetical protein